MRSLFAFITHNGTYKMVALFITLSLWVFIFERQEMVRTRVLDLDFILPADHYISNEVSRKVQFKVKGPRMGLKKFGEGPDSINVDLSNAHPGKTVVRIYEDILQLPHGVEVVSIAPSSLVVEIEKKDAEKKSGEGQ
jgi:YbbR domain-containing protein